METIRPGDSIFGAFPAKNVTGSGNGSSPGGNSGAVISPAPGLGLSSYQDPNIPVQKAPKFTGEVNTE